jgi:hypothetical protein
MTCWGNCLGQEEMKRRALPSIQFVDKWVSAIIKKPPHNGRHFVLMVLFYLLASLTFTHPQSQMAFRVLGSALLDPGSRSHTMVLPGICTTLTTRPA